MSHEPGAIFRDKLREDYFKLLHLAEDGEWEIVSSPDLSYVRDYSDDGSGTGEWFHPEHLTDRIACGEVEALDA